MVDLAHVGRRKTYLVAIARVASSSLCRDDALREFTLHSLANRLVYIASTRNTHSLVYVATSRQWVADSATETCRSTTERLNLCRVIMRLVLELQQPTLHDAIDIYIHENATCVILLALLHIVELTLLLEVASTYRCKFHKAEALLLTAKLLAHPAHKVERLLHLGLHERLVEGYLLNLGREGSMTAVVTPVGIEDAKLCLHGVTTLLTEVVYHLAEVVGIHSEAISLTVGS